MEQRHFLFHNGGEKNVYKLLAGRHFIIWDSHLFTAEFYMVLMSSELLKHPGLFHADDTQPSGSE